MTNPTEVLSPAAKKAAVELHRFIFDAKEPTILTAQHMATHEVLASLLAMAGRFHLGEAEPEAVLGSMLMAAA